MASASDENVIRNAEAYFEKHQIRPLITSLILELAKHQPADPIQALQEHLSNRAACQSKDGQASGQVSPPRRCSISDGTWQKELQRLVAEWDGGEAQPSEVSTPAVVPSQTLHTAEDALRSFRDRLQRVQPAEGLRGCTDWSRLVAAAPVDALDELEAIDAELEQQALPRTMSRSRSKRRKGTCVEVNSGGSVFFGLLAAREEGGKEEGVALKFCNSRHRRQSEQMAAELAWHLGVGAPESKLLLRAHDEEWQELKTAAEPLCEPLAALLATKQSLLIMQFVPGEGMHDEQEAWKPENLAASAHALGRLLVLDMLLGNADRLPIQSLAWRGNPHNVLWSGVSGACVPIDALVARRPPKLKVQEEDQKVGYVLELVLLEAATAQSVLLEAVAGNAAATSAIEQDWIVRDKHRAAKGKGVPAPVDAVKAFHEGVRGALTLALRERGLLEMVAGAIHTWFEEFHADVSEVTKASWRSRTAELRELSKQAERNDEVKERWSSWQQRLQTESLELWRAAEEWATQRDLKVPMSFKGFLGDTVLNPLMDAYELFVRLQHLVARIKVMAYAGSATRPCDLSPTPLLTGPATAAGCFHLLRKMGVTLILNCTSDLPAPAEAELGGIRWHRVALEDAEEQDLSAALEDGLKVVDEIVEAGGRALIHCHEGRSRSVSMALAYIVSRRRQPLAEAFALVKSKNPRARPNAGFWQQLVDLEVRELGSSSANEVTEGGPAKGKPRGLVCDICGETVGLTEEALAAHKRHKHKETVPGTPDGEGAPGEDEGQGDQAEGEEKDVAAQ